MFDDNIAWCDINSDDDFCIPDLPPLPPFESLFPPRVVKEKDERRTSISSTVSETSEKSSSAAESRKGLINEQRSSKTQDREQRASKTEDRFRFFFDQESSSKSKKPKLDYVCFIGKLPQETTVVDITEFVKSNGIQFTDVRMGPKKKPKANAFCYVDVPSKKDYDKLLALDGLLYKGCKIRTDHATRRRYSSQKKRKQTRKESKVVGLGYERQKSTATKSVDVGKRKKAKCNRFAGKKTQLSARQGTSSRRVGRNKATARSQRYKMIMRNQKLGSREKRKYLKSGKMLEASTQIRK